MRSMIIANILLWIVAADMWPTYREEFLYRWIIGGAIFIDISYLILEGKNILSKFTQFRTPLTRRR